MTAFTLGHPLRRLHLHLPVPRMRLGGTEREFRVPARPVWQTVVILYTLLTLLVAAVIGVAFLAALLVAGRAY